MSAPRASRPSAIPDIKPRTPVSRLDRSAVVSDQTFDPSIVGPLVGMSQTFIRKVVGHRNWLSGDDLLNLLDQDAFHETYVPRSQIPRYLDEVTSRSEAEPDTTPNPEGWQVRLGSALDLIKQVPPGSVNCVVTSTPYWGMRVYEDTQAVVWADGEICPYGHEQTPEGFARHTTEMLLAISNAVAETRVPRSDKWVSTFVVRPASRSTRSLSATAAI